MSHGEADCVAEVELEVRGRLHPAGEEVAASSLQDVSRSPKGLAVDRPETERVESRGKVTWLAQSAAAQPVELNYLRVQLNEGL